MSRIVILLSIVLTFLCTNAEARSHRHHSQHKHHHVHHRHHAIQHKIQVQPNLFSWFQPAQYQPTQTVKRVKTTHHYYSDAATQVLPHPSGCPARAFCGCGVSLEVYGRPIKELFLAANWYKFPRTSPAPNTVGVARHHVFVLKQHISGSIWMVYDANAGRHLTLLHPRSISGYTIVNPHGR
jgi:hypothetical protein